MVILGLSALLFSSFKLSLYTTLLGLQGAQSKVKAHARTGGPAHPFKYGAKQFLAPQSCREVTAEAQLARMQTVDQVTAEVGR